MNVQHLRAYELTNITWKHKKGAQKYRRKIDQTKAIGVSSKVHFIAQIDRKINNI